MYNTIVIDVIKTDDREKTEEKVFRELPSGAVSGIYFLGLCAREVLERSGIALWVALGVARVKGIKITLAFRE